MNLQIIRDDHRVKIHSSEVSASVIDGEVIIVHFSTGKYFSLQGVSARIWPAIEASHTIGEITDAIVNAYSIPYEQSRKDLLGLLYQLLDEGVVDLVRTVPEFEPDLAYQRPESRSHEDVERTMSYLPPRIEGYDDMQEVIALDGPMPPSPGDTG